MVHRHAGPGHCGLRIVYGPGPKQFGVHVQTILKVESGNPTTSLATMLRVLQVLGMGADIDAIAVEDLQLEPARPGPAAA